MSQFEVFVNITVNFFTLIKFLYLFCPQHLPQHLHKIPIIRPEHPVGIYEYQREWLISGKRNDEQDNICFKFFARLIMKIDTDFRLIFNSRILNTGWLEIYYIVIKTIKKNYSFYCAERAKWINSIKSIRIIYVSNIAIF